MAIIACITYISYITILFMSNSYVITQRKASDNGVFNRSRENKKKDEISIKIIN